MKLLNVTVSYYVFFLSKWYFRFTKVVVRWIHSHLIALFICLQFHKQHYFFCCIWGMYSVIPWGNLVLQIKVWFARLLLLEVFIFQKWDNFKFCVCFHFCNNLFPYRGSCILYCTLLSQFTLSPENVWTQQYIPIWST